MVNIWLIFNIAGIEGFLIIWEDFDKISSLACIVRISTKQGWKNDRVEVKQSRRERHDFKLEDSFLSGNVGKAVVQDGKSSDHEISGSPVISLCLLDLLFRICLCKSQTSVENLFDPNQISSYNVYCNS